MPYSYKDMKNDSQWKATTGLAEKDFAVLSAAFGRAYEMLHGVTIEQAAANLKQEFVLPTYGDCLFFVLFQLKNGLTQNCLGPLFGMDGASAWRNFHKCSFVLEAALQQQHALPKRRFQSVEEFKAYLHGEKEVTLDVSEYAIERPKQKDWQRENYSGKKKTHP